MKSRFSDIAHVLEGRTKTVFDSEVLRLYLML